jgi:hypothetical protein
MSALDSRMFGKDWWAQPLAARYASIDAKRAGLAVSVEVAKIPSYYKGVPCIIWRGTAEQFSATKTFPEGAAAKRASGKRASPGQLRGAIYPEGDGKFSFVIFGCYVGGKRDIKLHANEARADESYLNFRDAVMAGYPAQNLVDLEGISK